MKGSSGLTAGFTLVELVVTIAVAAILLTIAIPSFTRTVVSAKLSTTANEVVAALNTARLEAIRHNQPTQFCSNSATNNGNGSDALATACGTTAGAVYTLNSDGTTTLIHEPLQLQPGVLLGDGSGGTAGVTALRYGSNGLATTVTGTAPYSGLVADIYSQRISTNNHVCVYLVTGSLVSTHTCSSACNATNEPTSSC